MSDTSKTAKIIKRWYYSTAHWQLGDVKISIRDVQILKFLSPRQSADFDQGSAVSPRPHPREILDPRSSTSALIMNRPASSH